MTTKLAEPANRIGGGSGGARASAGARLAEPATGMKVRTRILLAALGCAAVLACNTPSVPLPPPMLAALSFTPAPTAGEVILTGAPGQSQLAGVTFYAINRATGDGVITTAAADGSFTTDPFPAAGGDVMEMYYDSGATGRSGSVCAQLALSPQKLLSIRCP
jgi:hypothetical protein